MPPPRPAESSWPGGLLAAQPHSRCAGIPTARLPAARRVSARTAASPCMRASSGRRSAPAQAPLLRTARSWRPMVMGLRACQRLNEWLHRVSAHAKVGHHVQCPVLPIVWQHVCKHQGGAEEQNWVQNGLKQALLLGTPPQLLKGKFTCRHCTPAVHDHRNGLTTSSPKPTKSVPYTCLAQ